MKIHNISIKNYLYTSLISLLSLIIIECNSPKDKNKASAVDDLITLMDLDVNSSPKLWDQFFTERGAQSIWQQLQKFYNKKSSNLEFSFNSLTKPSLKFITNKQATNDIIRGIIKYIVLHKWNIKTLVLSNNKLTEIPDEIGMLTSLETLDLSVNQLEEIPAEIGKLTKLLILNLTDNMLVTIPDEIGDLRELHTLLIERNQLEQLPANIGNLINLNNLFLANNMLKEIPPTIDGLNKLKVLNLSHNELSQIPREIGNLTDLKELDLSDNILTAVPSVMCRLAINKLDLVNNNLTKLPECIFNMLNEGAVIDLGDNPWLEKHDTNKLEKIVIDEEFINKNSREQAGKVSLKVLLMWIIQNHDRYATFDFNKLPQELSKEEQQKLLKDNYELLNNIVYFRTDGGKEVPLYLDWGVVNQEEALEKFDNIFYKNIDFYKII